jgi:hypothetical protein
VVNLALTVFPFILLALAAFGFWLWMLIDCLLRSDERFPNQGRNDKLIYTLVVVLTNIIGAFIYLFMVKLKAPKQPPASTEARSEQK